MRARKTTQPAALQLRRILVPVDFSERSRHAVKYAAALARKFHAALELLFVVEPAPLYSTLDNTPLTLESEELSRRGETMLYKLANAAVPRGLRVRTQVRRGKAAPEIIAAAAEGKCDLIVISTHGASGIERWLLGSTAEQVIRHAPCAVLTLRQGAAPPSVARLRRILVPVDFSKPSQEAVRYAARFARALKSELTIFHVVLSLPPPRRLVAFARGLEVEALRQARQDLAALVASEAMRGVDLATKLTAGVPRQEIVRAAGRWKADLLIIATHGRTGLERWVMGSTAEQVVRHAPCPVLVVRKSSGHKPA